MLTCIFFIHQIETGRSLNTNDLTLKKLKNDLGYKGIFIGIGNPEPKIIPIFKSLTEEQGFFTSKGFLPKVSCCCCQPIFYITQYGLNQHKICSNHSRAENFIVKFPFVGGQSFKTRHVCLQISSA